MQPSREPDSTLTRSGQAEMTACQRQFRTSLEPLSLGVWKEIRRLPPRGAWAGPADTRKPMDTQPPLARSLRRLAERGSRTPAPASVRLSGETAPSGRQTATQRFVPQTLGSRRLRFLARPHSPYHTHSATTANLTARVWGTRIFLQPGSGQPYAHSRVGPTNPAQDCGTTRRPGGRVWLPDRSHKGPVTHITALIRLCQGRTRRCRPRDSTPQPQRPQSTPNTTHRCRLRSPAL